MKILTRSLVAALALAFGFSGAAVSYAGDCGCGDVSYGCGAGACGAYDCGGCYDNCCGLNGCCDDGAGGIGFFGEAELLFLRYHRADGVRIGGGATENGEFDFEPAYRFSLGLIGPGGIGVRARYFEYDHFEQIEDAGDGLGVDTYNIDIELFEAFELNQNWAAEVSGGVRWNGFREQMIDVGELDDRQINSDTGGLVTGLELRRSFGPGLLYARTRMAVVQGDKDIFNRDGGVVNQNIALTDVTQAQLEIALGSEVNYELANGAVLFARSGVEMQHWWSFSNEFDQAGNIEGFWDGPADVGFGGFTLSAGISY